MPQRWTTPAEGSNSSSRLAQISLVTTSSLEPPKLKMMPFHDIINPHISDLK